MKKTIFKTGIAILMAVGMVTLNSCEKETTTPPTTSKSEVDQNFGKFTKEVTVYDETGKNSAVLKLGSNDQSILDLWTAENFTLIPITDAPADNEEIPEDNSDVSTDDEDGNISASVSVMILSRDLKDDVKAISLKPTVPDSGDLRLDWFYLTYYSIPGWDKFYSLIGRNFWRRAYADLYFTTYQSDSWRALFVDRQIKNGENINSPISDVYAMKVITRQKKENEILVSFWK